MFIKSVLVFRVTDNYGKTLDIEYKGNKNGISQWKATDVQKGGDVCPVCGSRNLWCEDLKYDKKKKQVHSIEECKHCSSTWKGVYSLTGFVSLINAIEINEGKELKEYERLKKKYGKKK